MSRILEILFLSLVALLVVLVAAAAGPWSARPERGVVFGTVLEGGEFPGAPVWAGWLERPGAGRLRLVVEAPRSDPLASGDWLVACGRIRELDGIGIVFWADRVAQIPVAGWCQRLVDRSGAWTEALPRLSRVLLILVALATLAVGFHLLRWVAALALVLALGAIAWLALVLVPVAAGLPGMAEEAVPWAIVVALCCLALGLAVRPTSLTGGLAQRLTGVALVGALLPAAASTFDWPAELARAVLLLGALVSPAVGLWLVAGLCLALGLGASGSGGSLILAVCGVALTFQERKGWLPSWRLPGRRRARERPRDEHLLEEGA